MLHHEQNIPGVSTSSNQHFKKLLVTTWANIPGVIYALHKVKDRVNFGLGGKKKEATIDSYF